MFVTLSLKSLTMSFIAFVIITWKYTQPPSSLSFSPREVTKIIDRTNIRKSPRADRINGPHAQKVT